MSGLLDWIDDRLGDGLEKALCTHHARRLQRLGWGEVLESGRAGSFSARAPARTGCRIEVLADGEHALPAMVEAIAGARSHVHVAGWYSSPDFRPTRGRHSRTFREILAATAEHADVRVLLWAGPPAPIFQPTRKMARHSRAEFMRDSKVRCVLDARERTLHCHHEKLVIVDDEIAFVGGMDFTGLDGDRHDSPKHPADRPIGWHDTTMRVEGPVVVDVAEHFRQRWSEVAHEDLPRPLEPDPAGTSTVQFVRTIPEKTYDFMPHGDFSLLDSYVLGLRSAERLVYLENQFLWSPEITEVLIDKLRDPPDDRFRVVLLLPRKPSNGSDTTRGQLSRLLDADDSGNRLLAVTLTSHDGAKKVPVYVHSKLGIVDDRWMTVGSANLNEHSLFNDTEANLVTDDEKVIRETRLRLWAEHLELPESEVAGDPADVVDRLWRRFAEQHDSHRLTMLPGISRRSERLEGPLRGLLVDG